MIISNFFGYNHAREAKMRLWGFSGESVLNWRQFSSKTQKNLCKLEALLGVTNILPITLVFILGIVSMFIASNVDSTFFVLLIYLTGFWLAMESWHAFCFLVVKLDYVAPWSRSAKITEILRHDSLDSSLALEVTNFFKKASEEIRSTDIDPIYNEIRPKDHTASWIPIDVQFHRTSSAALAGRDVTMLWCSNSDHEDTLVTIVPSTETVLYWFKNALGGLEYRFEHDTHCSQAVEHIGYLGLLKKVWRPAEGVLHEIGIVGGQTKLPYEERPKTKVFGSLRKDGSVLLHALQSEKSFATIAPISALVLLGQKLNAILENHVGNPVIIQRQ